MQPVPSGFVNKYIKEEMHHIPTTPIPLRLELASRFFAGRLSRGALRNDDGYLINTEAALLECLKCADDLIEIHNSQVEDKT